MEQGGSASPSTVKPVSAGKLATRRGTFVINGEYWTIGYDGDNFSLRNVLGLSYIQRLLQHPDQEFNALDLLAEPGVGTTLPRPGGEFQNDEHLMLHRGGDAGPILDQRAKQEYRRKILELKEDLAELRQKGDYEQGVKAEAEIDFLTRQLAQATGIRGADRVAGSAAERARLNVTRAIRSAIERIAKQNPSLGQVLGNCIRTGSFCCYTPDPEVSIAWNFAVEPSPMAATLSIRPGDSSLIRPTDYPTAFIGRENERAILRGCLKDAKSGAGRIAIIAGPPGIGKTRLSRELGEEARRKGFLVLAGSCYEREDAVPFSPFVELLEAAVARAPTPTALREMLGNEAPEMTRLLPQLRRTFPDLPEPLVVAPQQSRRLLFNACLHLVARQSDINPVLLLLEDLHWADEGTLSLLFHFGQSTSGMRLMIIGTHRDDPIDLKPPLNRTLDELTRLRVVERIPLSGLPQNAVAQLIKELSGQEPSAVVVEHIYSNTDGNPLFVEELVRQLEQSQTNSADTRPPAHDDEHLPPSLRLVIGRRLALVSRETARVLGTAAVIGRSFTFALLEASTHADPDRLIDAVEEAESAGLISSRLQYPDARFDFAHEVIRRAVLEELSTARKQRLHLNVAQALELLHPNTLEDHAEDLAHHFWSAGVAADLAKTVRYLQAAGEKAARSSANEMAIGYFRKALQLIQTLPKTQERLHKELMLEISLGSALMATRGLPTSEVVEVHARARELSLQLGEATQFFRVLWGQWLSCASRGDHRAALEVARQCLEVAQGASDPLLLAQAHHALGAGYCTVGEFTEARGHLEQAVKVDDPVRQRLHADTYGHDPVVLSLILSGFALWFLGYPEQAVQRNDQGMALARKLSHPATSAMGAAFAAQVQQFCRNTQAVEELAGLAVDLSTRHEIAFPRAMGTILGGWAMTQRGQKEAGVARMRRALDALRASGAVLLMGYFSLLLAGELEPEEGLSVLAAVDNAREHHWAAELYRLKGELLLRQGRINQREAEQCFGRALTISREKKAKSLELRAAMSICRRRLREGNRLEARLALEDIFRSFTEGFDTPDLRDAKTLLEEL